MYIMSLIEINENLSVVKEAVNAIIKKSDNETVILLGSGDRFSISKPFAQVKTLLGIQ